MEKNLKHGGIKDSDSDLTALQSLRHVICSKPRMLTGSEIKLLLVPDKYETSVARYDKDLKNFEICHGISSGSFYEKFEAGKMGDAADFFEWSGLTDLRNDLIKKLSRPESV